MLVARNHPPNNLVRLLPERTSASLKSDHDLQVEVWRGRPLALDEDWTSRTPAYPAAPTAGQWVDGPLTKGTPEIDPLYLLASQLEWEYTADPSAAWEVISATRSWNSDTRAHALPLLERTQELKPQFPEDLAYREKERRSSTKEVDMRAPYGLDVIESCMGCKTSRDSYFCRFSQPVLRSVDAASYHSVMPSGALLFVEGQTPRGVYVLSSGKVRLSTTSKEGKVLILKQAESGEVLGLSAAISGTNYEMTAETCTPCQLNFIGRQDLMTLLQNESEVGVHAAQSLSREFQGAYRDIHDLVLARSSSGKLARLLLSCAPRGSQELNEQRLHSAMTHEEMAQRIGSSRETVTRLLSNLKKRRLIRLEGATLVIRDRTGLEALAV
ncbi:MAG: Crp/Fnr family transcriptional regulator [Candidatus Sulfotelmatobacter sp.]